SSDLVVLAHGGDVGLGVGGPGTHGVGVGAGVVLDGLGRAAVGIAFAEDGVDGGAEDLGVAGADVFLGVGGRGLGELGKGVALGLEFGDGGLELRDGGGDVGELDDVGLGALGQRAEFGEGVGGLWAFGEMVRGGGEEAGGDGDVAGLDGDAGVFGVGWDERQERVGGEGRGFVGLGVDDGGL